jgi:hypothetical protein
MLSEINEAIRKEVVKNEKFKKKLKRKKKLK